MKCKLLGLACGAILQLIGYRFAVAQEIYMSYPGLTGESAPLWIARETGILKEYGIDANLVYMKGGRLSIQSLLSGTTQFMTGDAVSALSAVAGGEGDQEHIRDKPTSCAEARRYRHQALPLFCSGAAVGG